MLLPVHLYVIVCTSLQQKNISTATKPHLPGSGPHTPHSVTCHPSDPTQTNAPVASIPPNLEPKSGAGSPSPYFCAQVFRHFRAQAPPPLSKKVKFVICIAHRREYTPLMRLSSLTKTDGRTATTCSLQTQPGAAAGQAAPVSCTKVPTFCNPIMG